MTVAHTDGPVRHFTANSTAMGRDLRVILDSSGYLQLAGAEDIEIGTLEQKSVGNLSESVEVRLRNAEGTFVGVANAAITVNSAVYGAESGKVSSTKSGNFLGWARTAASADGDRVEVQRAEGIADPIDGAIVIDEDFIGDWPAAATGLTGQGKYAWTKTETNGLGVTSLDAANGVVVLAFDAVAEVATATLFMENSPIDPTVGGTAEFLLKVADAGDNAALAINFGMASDDHADTFQTIAELVAFTMVGGLLNLYTDSDDGTLDTGSTDSGVDLVQTNWYAFKIDWHDLSDVKFYYRAKDAAAWTRLNSGTTYDVSDASANWTPIVMIAKTSNDTTAAVHVDRIKVTAGRAA